ncbi:MAG: tRNA lysidine(34) synthetase TilS [Opitutaceae bacterium]
MPRGGTGPRSRWQSLACRLAESLPLASLHPAVVRAARTTSKRNSSGWAVALSGGSDSVALLLLIWVHWPEQRNRLTVMHFNHRLRGKDSDDDSKFCRSVCRSLTVRFRTERWKQKDEHRITEANLRAARLDFFRRVMAKENCSVLWLGHQQDDIAETMLMRLARGSGLGGLIAPRPVHRFQGNRWHLRPLLTQRKQVIAGILRDLGIPWREDRSNAGDDYLRNRMRHRVLKAWQRAEPLRDVVACVADAREKLEEDATALDELTDALRALRSGRLDLRKIKGAPKALVRRVLHRWRLALGDRCGQLSRQAFDTLLIAVMVGKPTRFSLGNAGFAVIRGFVLRFEAAVPKVSR